MLSHQHTARIKALGDIEGFSREMQDFAARLDGMAQWRPAVSLAKQCREIQRLIDDIGERIDRRLTVTIVGPGGAGKSTLFNALAGGSDLSTVGVRRPTTQKLVVLADDRRDAERFAAEISAGDTVLAAPPPGTPLANLVLVDTPDTDSTLREGHIPMVQAAVARADVLLCVFNAENPKTRDHVDFFAPLVELFHGDSLIGVLNKCDRLDENELKSLILPQFEAYIQEAWNQPLNRILCISARRHLSNPAWDDKAPPRHDFDQFDRLRAHLTSTWRRPDAVTGRRRENAASLRDYMRGEIRRELAQDRARLEKAKDLMLAAEQAAFKNAFASLLEEGKGHGLGVNVLLYQKLSHRWFGPVGWVVALWARILIFGSGMMAVFRFGNPLGQLLGMVRSLLRFKETSAFVAEVENSTGLAAAFRQYRLAVLRRWPAIAALLSRARFSADGSGPEKALPADGDWTAAVSGLWRGAFENAIEKTSRRFSGTTLQLLINAPSIGILAHAGWVTGRHYFTGQYLSSDFFLHAFMTIAIVLLLSFFALQTLVRVLAAPDRLMSQTFKALVQRIAAENETALNPVLQEIEKLLRLLPSEPSNQ